MTRDVAQNNSDARGNPDEEGRLRRGPHPLPVYVSGASMQAYAAPEKMRSMLRGIKLYQEHKYSARHDESLQTVWQKETARVLYCAAKNLQQEEAARGDKAAVNDCGAKPPTLFIIPSMINRADILDLQPEFSFVRWMAQQGIDVYLLDWGTPIENLSMTDMDGALANFAIAALEDLFGQGEGDSGRAAKKPFVHALGYCMGGTFLAAAAQHCQGLLRSATFLAAPWDFHAGDRHLTNGILAGLPAALQMIGVKGALPAKWIQSVFASVQVERAIQKFVDFAAMDQDSDKAKRFVAVEDWLNNGLDMPQHIAECCLLQWYRDNRTAKGLWHALGAEITPQQLSMPCLVVASDMDRLVPLESSLALAQQIPDCSIVQPDYGHIGMMTSRNAPQEVWPLLRDWVLQH